MIVFTPLRASSRASGPDLSVHLRRHKGAMILELSFSAAAQERLRYIQGDRVIPSFDDNNQCWLIKRAVGDEERQAYKVSVRKMATSGKTVASFRATCTPQQANAVLGPKDRAEYEFLEVADNVATFVQK